MPVSCVFSLAGYKCDFFTSGSASKAQTFFIAGYKYSPYPETRHAAEDQKQRLQGGEGAAVTGRAFATGIFAAILALVMTMAMAPRSAAQTELASVYGRVTDQSGAVIVDAEVEIKNVETNQSVTVRANQDGLYTIPSLHPGHYLINVRKTGFKSVTVTELTLNVQDNVVRNFALQVGSIAETVTVRADDLHINTTDATVSTVVDRQFAENLPMNGRSFQTLIELTPGVVLTSANYNEQGQFSVNGQRANANYFTIDGTSANIGVSAGNGLVQSASGSLPGFGITGGTNNLVSIDALQEFRIQTSSFAPEFGRTPGGQISMVTRSGTNQFHGTAFEYFRNDVLDANDWFANANKLSKPAERQNDFGGTFSGPLVKDRTFFFFSYEGLRLRQPQTAITTVPSTSARQNAALGTQPLLNSFPLPNGQDFGDGTAEFAGTFSDPTTLNATSIRVDHKIGDRLTVFGRYNYAPSRVKDRGAGGFNALSNVALESSNIQTLTAGSTFVISPRLSDEFRFNWSRSVGSAAFVSDNFGGAVALSEASLFPSGFSAQDSLFGFFIFDLSPFDLLLGRLADNLQRQYNVVDNLSVVKGAHQLRFGGDYRRLSPIPGNTKYQQFPFFFTVAQAETGVDAFASVKSSPPFPTLRFTNLSLYAQDTWRAGPRLTLTYGLRWEFNPAPSTDRDAPFAATGVHDPTTLAIASVGAPLYATTYRNFAPRLGVAYQLRQNPGRETVLRGGGGMFYDLGSQEAGQILTTSSAQYSAQKFLVGTQFPLTASEAAPPTLNPNPPFGFLTLFDPALKLPRTYQWNVSLEQALGTNQTMSFSYIGGLGRNLQRVQELSNPNPDFQTVDLVLGDATSDYHALQLQFQRRLSRGLQALASYTWSHSIDSVSNSGTPDTLAVRGASDFDIRHTFTAAVTYNIAAPRTRTKLNWIIQDWSVDGVVIVRSALPVNVIAQSFATLNGANQSIRPDLIPDVPLYLYGPQYPGGKAFNNTVDPSRPGCKGPFCVPPAGQQGDLGRNVLRGFGVAQTDLGVHRQFNLAEGLNLQFRAEIFNVFNHPNFGPPNNSLSSGLFGESTQMLAPSLGSGGGTGGFNPLYQIGGPRSIQFALKLNF